ncbi:MAG: hypothetical protein ACOX84_08940, partial [Methanothrix sp.]
DKAYFGAKTKGYDAAMKKATRGHPLSYKDEMRNKRISRKRSPARGSMLSSSVSARQGMSLLLRFQGLESR